MKTGLNICIVSREYPPETLWGGIGTFTYNLAHGLKNIGHNVDVIAFATDNESHTTDSGINIYRIGSPKIPFTRISTWDLTSFALTPFAFMHSLMVKKKLAELQKEKYYDVIDFPEHIGEGFFTIRSGKYPSLVRLYTPLSLIGKMGLNRTTNAIDYFLFGLMEKASIKEATIVNSPSRSLAELVKKEFKLNREIRLVYNPIDTDKFSPGKDALKEKTGMVKVLFVGRLDDRKGVHILAQAIPKVAATFNNVKFIILGSDGRGVDGFKSMKDFMLKVFNEHGVTEKVDFATPVPYDELPSYYNSADLMVVPSMYDNSPYTCLEAMSCGLPVIGTSAGGMPEYIDENENGLIVPTNDVDALAAALTDLLTNSEKRMDFAQKARLKAVNCCRREVIAENMTALYIEAIDLFQKSQKK